MEREYSVKDNAKDNTMGNAMGHSNAIITIMGNQFIKYGDARLEKQGEKQMKIKVIYDSVLGCFQVPKIIATFHKKEVLKMDLITNAQGIPDFLEHCSPDNVKQLWQTIKHSLETIRNKCDYVYIKNIIPVFEDKINQLKKVIPPQFYHWFDYIHSCLDEQKHEIIPIGFCHGDMTLCNMLVNNEGTCKNAIISRVFAECAWELLFKNIQLFLQYIKNFLSYETITYTSLFSFERNRKLDI